MWHDFQKILGYLCKKLMRKLLKNLEYREPKLRRNKTNIGFISFLILQVVLKANIYNHVLFSIFCQKEY